MIVYLATKGLSYMMTLTAYVMPEKQGWQKHEIIVGNVMPCQETNQRRNKQASAASGLSETKKDS